MITLSPVQIERFRMRVRGMYSGAYMGDVLGFPWECLTAAQILEKTGGRGVESIHTKFEPRYLDAKWGDRLRYEDSDDSRLTRATGRGLCRAKRLNIPFVVAQAIEHLAEIRQGIVGCGPTILEGLALRNIWFETAGFAGLNPRIPVAPNVRNEGGTGPLMKTSFMAVPAALAQMEVYAGEGIEVYAQILRDIYLLAGLTHAGDAALVTIPYTILLAQFLNPYGMTGDVRVFLDSFNEWVEVLRHGRGEICGSVANERRAVELCEVVFSAVQARQPKICAPASDWPLSELGYYSTSVNIEKQLAACALDPQKTGMTGAMHALATAVMSPFTDSLPAAVLHVINLGGDTDTHGCITGALAGAYHGWSDQLPDWWREYDVPARAFVDEFFDEYVRPQIKT